VTVNVKTRYEGALLGLAAGDALGTTVEFKSPGTFEPLSDIIGGGPFKLKRGAWTDDTSMALCLAESLIECRAFDAADQMERYIRWWREGYLSSTGFCFDIGGTTAQALQNYIRTEQPFAGSTSPRAAGNGSLMRLAPAPLFFAADPELAVRMSAESSRTTHGAVTCLDACRYYGGLIIGAVNGVSKEELLAPRYAPVPGLWEREPLCAEIDEVAAGSFKNREPPAIIGSGYVVKALEAALWAFSRSTNFKEGALHAVNLGYDADTTGAIYGQLAGAHYGADGIPESWRACLAQGELIWTFAGQLYDIGQESAPKITIEH
jgi:ADP-ribosylglycohydrolase